MSGTDKMMAVPWWLVLTSTQPPTVRARSCRPRIPKDLGLARSSSSRPLPLSLISSDNDAGVGRHVERHLGGARVFGHVGERFCAVR